MMASHQLLNLDLKGLLKGFTNTSVNLRKKKLYMYFY